MRPALQVRGVSAVQPGTSAPDEAAARDPHAPPLFSRSRTGLFFQAQPQLKNPFLEDPLLGRYLRRHLPPQQAVFSDLQAFGERISGEVDAWGPECEVNPPRLPLARRRWPSRSRTGPKWFTSATDADMTLTLGRVVGRHGSAPPGRLEGIEVQRLKDKLGTRQMPTAELLLDGLPAHRVSGSPPPPRGLTHPAAILDLGASPAAILDLDASPVAILCRVPIPVLSVLRTQSLSTEYVPIRPRRKEVPFKYPDAVLKTG
ncbi:unnamed protein product [Boreogadus saida]